MAEPLAPQPASRFLIVMGLDPSLTGSGMAGTGWSQRLNIKGSGVNRLRAIRHEIAKHAAQTDTEVVLIEGPAFMSSTGHAHERAGLWWLVCEQLDAAGIEVISVSPNSLKKYATGKGNADKDEVLAAAIRRLPSFTGTKNDEADAAWLHAMGDDHFNGVVHVPESHRVALEKVPWPSLAS